MKKSFKIVSLVLASMMLMSSCGGKTVEAVKEETKVETKAAESKPVVSNEIFSVSVPEKFDGLYDTEVNDHTVNFYDKESKKEGNPGWLFGIQVFENANDWAGGPTEKVGELKLNSGKLYDVIISLPTESQFGFNSDGTEKPMPANYKKMYDARFEIAGCVSSINGEKVDIGAGTKGERLYKEVLEKHLKAIEESWDADKLEKEEMSSMYVAMASGDGKVLDTAGYAYRDINHDGIDELLIGEISDGDWKGIIYDIYTIVDREPKHVVSGWDRNRFYDYDDSLLVNEYSSGANESGVIVYSLNSNTTDLMLQLAFKYDGYTDEKNPWYLAYVMEKDEPKWEKTTEQEYNDRQDRFSKHTDPGYKAFSTLK